MRKFELHHYEVKLLLAAIDYTRADIKLKTMANPEKYSDVEVKLRKLASNIRGQVT